MKGDSEFGHRLGLAEAALLGASGCGQDPVFERGERLRGALAHPLEKRGDVRRIRDVREEELQQQDVA